MPTLEKVFSLVTEVDHRVVMVRVSVAGLDGSILYLSQSHDVAEVNESGDLWFICALFPFVCDQQP